MIQGYLSIYSTTGEVILLSAPWDLVNEAIHVHWHNPR